METRGVMQAQPFCKMAGGKRQLLWRLTEIMPTTIATFFEGFVGGGALFFALSNAGRFKRAVLSDTNEELIRLWLVVQRNAVGLLRELDKHEHTRKHFEKVREQDPAKLTDEACGARYIFLNRAGFNGLMRYNKAGRFNTPFGKQAKMLQFIDPQVIKAAAAALNARPVTIVCADFEDATRKMRLGDAGFFDPPYAPVAKGSFTAYGAAGFSDDDQRRLAAWFGTLSDRGMRVLLSNSSCEFVDKLYHRHSIERVFAKRSINSDATKRGDVREVLVKSRALVNE